MAALGFALFLVWELDEPNPIVDLRLFKRRNFRAGTPAVGWQPRLRTCRSGFT